MLKIYIPVLLIVLLTAGCQTVYYAPTAHNVPVFEEKHEVRVSGYMGSGGEVGTRNLQAAYALTNRVALMAAYCDATGNSFSLKGKGEQFDMGGGVFFPFSKCWVFETYGMFARGKSTLHSKCKLTDKITTSYNKYYIQPSISLTTPYLDVALSSRMAYLDMYDVQGGFVYGEFTRDRALLHAARNSFLVEYGITLRAGWKYIKLQTQLNFSTFLSRKRIPAETESLSLGLIFSWGHTDI
jgi:hypothetical protein